MNFKTNNRPKLPRNRFGWVDQGGNGGSGSGGSGLDSNTLNSIYDLIDWFYKVGDVVHSRYSFAGDYEVAAFRDGSSGVVNTYNASWIDSSFAWLIGYIADSSATGDGPHIPDSSIRAWNDAADKSHTHENKSVLDSISNQDLANWRNTALDVSTWFYWDNETNTLHTPFSFVGDLEVAAWLNGSSGDISTYNASWIDSSYAYLLNQIENVSGGSGGGGADIPNASVLAWNEAYNKAHTHNNKSILDGISDSSISIWNSAYIDLNDWFYKDSSGYVHSKYTFVGDNEVAAHGYGEGGQTDTYNTSFIDSSYQYIIDLIYSIPEGGGGTIIPDSSIRTWNEAYNKAHTHDNKSVLDGISSVDLNSWRDTCTNFNDWFYKDSSGYVHSKYTLVGDHEVTAHGYGEGGQADTYNTSWIDSSFAWLVDLIENVSGGSGGGSDIPNVSVSNWNEAYNKAHTHNNKAILDGISDSSISTWNSAYIDLNDWFYKDSSGYVHSRYTLVGDNEVAAHGYGEGSQVDTYNTSWIDSSFAWLVDLIENVSGGSGSADIPNVSVSNWNEAYNKAHTHTNKSVLDSISNTDLSHWNDTCTNFNDWFYKDSSGFVHSRYTFVGDNEVAAHGYGMDGIVESYSKQHIDTSYNDLLDLIRDISGGGGDISLIDYAKKQWVEDNFLRNVSFNEYKAITNISINYINTSINDISTRLANANASVVDLKDWFYKDSSGYVHSKYTFVGDNEVAAHGYGLGGIVESYSKQHIDSSYNYILDVIDDISVDIDLSEYVKKTVFNSSYNALNTKVNEVSTRLNNVSTRLNNVSTRLNNVSTRLSTTNASVNTLEDWFYKDSSGFVHSRYTFVGDNEVAAHGYGQGGIVESYSKQHIDSSYNYILDVIDDISVYVDLSDYVKNASFNALNTKVDNVSSRLNNVSTRLNNVSTRLSTTNASVNTLNTKVDEVSTRLNNVSTRLNNVSTRLNNVSTRLNTTNTSVNTLEDWFYKDSSGYVHSKYTFVGDNEVAAHGYGQGGIVESYSKQHIDSSYNYILDVIDDISVYVDLSDYVKNASFNALNTKVDNVSSRLNNVSTRLNNVSTRLNDVSTRLNNVSTRLNTTNTSVNTLNTKVDNVSTRLYNVSTRLNNVSTRLAPLTDWFYKDSSGRVHSRYSFVGDEEVAAFGAGESGGEIDLTNYVKIHADGQLSIYSPIYVENYLEADDIYSFGNLTTDGDVIAWTDASIFRDIKVGRNALINGTLKVGGISNFNSSIITKTNASIGNKLFVKGTTTLTGNSSINDSLFVKNDVSLGGKLYTNEIRTPVNISTFVLNSSTQISGNTTISGNLTLPSAVSRIQIGPTTIGAVYDSSIIFGNTNFASIRARKDPNNGRTKLVLSSGDILSFSGSYATIDCEFNHSGEDITGVGTIYCDGVDTGSDRRLKTNIKDLEFKGSLNPVEFDMISTGKHSIGFIAQQVQENYPLVVHEDENGYLSLDYPKITAVLSAQINYLEDKITLLEKKLKENGLI